MDKLLNLTMRSPSVLRDSEKFPTTSAVSFALNHTVVWVRAVWYIAIGTLSFFSPDNPKNELVCGVITGMSTAPNDSTVLYIADCNRGIFKLDLKAGREIVSLVDTRLPIADVPPMRMITDLAVLSNGSIYFIDGSSKFGINQSVYEIFEAGDNGNLLHYNPADGSVRMVASGLHFPKGLCASHDESFLMITESTRFRILK